MPKDLCTISLNKMPNDKVSSPNYMYFHNVGLKVAYQKERKAQVNS